MALRLGDEREVIRNIFLPDEMPGPVVARLREALPGIGFAMGEGEQQCPADHVLEQRLLRLRSRHHDRVRAENARGEKFSAPSFKYQATPLK